MTYSIGEISDLCVKAARGCGKPWGLAEEVGWAIRWLARSGLPGADRLALVLTGKDGICPFTLGATIADTNQLSLLEAAGEVSEPVLLLPFLSRLVPEKWALSMKVDDQQALVWSSGAIISDPIPQLGTFGSFEEAPIPTVTPPKHLRIESVSPAALRLLKDLAMRTYAPATSSSRLSGAGAGLVDND